MRVCVCKHVSFLNTYGCVCVRRCVLPEIMSAESIGDNVCVCVLVCMLLRTSLMDMC